MAHDDVVKSIDKVVEATPERVVVSAAPDSSKAVPPMGPGSIWQVVDHAWNVRKQCFDVALVRVK